MGHHQSVIVMHESLLVWAVTVISVVMCHLMNLALHRIKYMILPGPLELLQMMAASGSKTFTRK